MIDEQQLPVAVKVLAGQPRSGSQNLELIL
jgi:hypothetical protein